MNKAQSLGTVPEIEGRLEPMTTVMGGGGGGGGNRLPVLQVNKLRNFHRYWLVSIAGKVDNQIWLQNKLAFAQISPPFEVIRFFSHNTLS